jgi:hypothetical protein
MFRWTSSSSVGYTAVSSAIVTESGGQYKRCATWATDARSALVSTVDGRTFSTTDGGATWRRQ